MVILSIRQCFFMMNVAVIIICITVFFPQFNKINKTKFRYDKYTINTDGCRILSFNEYNENISSLLKKPKHNYTCWQRDSLVKYNETSIWIDTNVVNKLGFNLSDLNCGYYPFKRLEPFHDTNDTRVKYEKRVQFTKAVNIEEQYIFVECRKNDTRKLIFKDMYSFLPTKLFKSMLKNKVKDDKRWNVAILGLSSISRLHLHRTMPKTVKTLRGLGAVEMFGYNKLEQNTFSNIIPLLTGMTWIDLRTVCWPSNDARFDKCPFIFKSFSEKEYLTIWGEDISNILKNGFNQQPVDIYWNVFGTEAKRRIGHYYKIKKYPYCLGNRPGYAALLNYSEQVMKKCKKFHQYFLSFTWLMTLSNDEYESNTFRDDGISKYLLRLKQIGTLDNTILILMSDHGYRFGKFAETLQGFYEDRLPFMFWILPSEFSKMYPTYVNNLKDNAYKLVTTFDVHATLLHILNMKSTWNRFINRFTQRGVSLFFPITDKRTCFSAGIPMHYCTCTEKVAINISKPIVKHATEYLLAQINQLVATIYNKCSILELDYIESATTTTIVESLFIYEVSVQYYTILFVTLPGSGSFSGTVRYHNSRFDLSGSISRLNHYEKQSYCVNNPIIKLFCNCISTNVPTTKDYRFIY